MQKVIDDLREDLAAFVEQRESLTLVLWAKNPTDTLYAVKLMESLDEASERDVILVFTEDCYDPERYLDALMAACEMEIETGNAAIAQDIAQDAGSEGAEPWDSLPGACFEASLGAPGRVRELVDHIRRYYPDVVHRIVLAFLPAELSQPSTYAAFVRELLPGDGYEPWMAGVRYIVVDSQRGAQLVPELSQREGDEVLVRPIDFSADALSQALVEQATDPATPDEQRILSLVQVAALDHSWKRYPDAIQKYGQAYSYYLGTKNTAMQAVCLLFVGHTFEQMGEVESAKEKFRQALELALSDGQQQTMLNAFMALGMVHQREQDWRAGAEYWAGAAFTAKAMGNPYALADASQNAGTCHIALNEVSQALEHWNAAREVSTQVGYWERTVTVLEHLVEVEGREEMAAEQEAHERELESARGQLEAQRHEGAQARGAMVS